MSKAINGWVLFLLVAVAWYTYAMYNDAVALKYYPQVNELHFDASDLTPEQTVGRLKFVTVALTAMLVALPALLVGYLLPKKSGYVLHILTWATLITCSVLMLQRELKWFSS